MRQHLICDINPLPPYGGKLQPTLGMGVFMHYFKLFLLFLMLLSAKSYALLITDTIAFNKKLNDRNNFNFDLIEQGYNPFTDVITRVELSYDIKEIVEDPFEDDATMDDAREFIMIYDRFMFIRGVFPDIDTGVYRSWMHWTRQEDCRYADYSNTGEEICSFHPDKDGLFYSFWDVYTDNLWLNSISLSIDVTRKSVDEPSSLLLFASLLFLLAFRSRKRLCGPQKAIQQ